MNEARIVLTTVGNHEVAENLADQLIQRRLAACVNIVGPIRSLYRWKEKIEREAEYLLLIKTTAQRTEELAATFKELHPYDLPECIELAIASGSEEYLAWLVSEVKQE